MKSNLFKFLDDSKMMKLIIFIIYFIINFLFLVKYGSRQEKVPILFLAVIFILIHGIFYFSYNSIFNKLTLSSKTIYVLVIVTGITYLFLSHLTKDPYALKIDRWQTAEYSLDYWLHGKYIYSTRNFMGNVPSYLPGQLLFLVCFYLIGNVGYLQVVSLVLFSFAVIKEFKANNTRLLGVLMMFFSLSFIYEAVCKSDFISSFIIISFFIIYWSKKYKDNYFQKPLLLGFILGVLCLTRSVVVVPLILFLCRPFFEASWTEKIKFTLMYLITIIVLLLSILLPAENFDYILAYNPLGMQGQSNIFAILIFLSLSVFLSFIVKKIRHIFYLSTIIVFSLMCVHIMEQLLRETTFNYLNITYLAAALPFCIISFCFLSQKEIVDNSQL